MTAETLTESRIHCPTNEKDIYLYYFLQQHPGRTMVFCNSIDCVRRLVNLFELMWTEPLGLHAQMHQRQRLKNLERFSANDNGKCTPPNLHKTSGLSNTHHICYNDLLSFYEFFDRRKIQLSAF